MRAALAAVLLLCAGCPDRSDSTRPIVDPPGPFPVDAFAPPPPTDWCRDDSDGDTIADREESAFGPGTDTDADGLADVIDLDSDGDGLTDAEEAGDTDRCTPARHCDGDGTPDAQDLDSDGDGVLDAEEIAMGTEPCNADSDADGCTDYAERVLDGCTDPDDVILGGDCFSWRGVVQRTVPGEGTDPISGITLVLRDVPGEPPFPYSIRIAAYDAQPPAGVSGRTSSGFTGVVPGTTVSFEISGEVGEDLTRRPDARYVFVQRVLLLGPGGRILDESRAIITIVPGCVLVI